MMGKKFDMIDPYNHQNRVEGVIYLDNEHYGSMLVKKVNDRDCEQYIHCTPKFYYPGNVDSIRKYKPDAFPDDCVIDIYEKIDGTNILMFHYHDADDNDFVSFKTRLVPFLRNEGFKPWIDMWGKMLEKYPEIMNTLSKVKESNFAFEMFGAINEILIKYEVPLDTRWIYGINVINGEIFPPGEGLARDETCEYLVPASKWVDNIIVKNKMEAHDTYMKRLDQIEKIFLENRGAEGYMFYIFDYTTEKCFAWKCKPKVVVEAQGDSGSKLVGYVDAYATAMNAMESSATENLLQETLLLLQETYDKDTIDLSMKTITNAVEDAIRKVRMRDEILSIFRSTGLKWGNLTPKSPKEKKDTVMKVLMKSVSGRYNASDVFNVLSSYFSVFNEQ